MLVSQPISMVTRPKLHFCLLKMMSILLFARGEATAVVLLDQSAAFDIIDHSTLIECLSSWFGVGGMVLDWFKSYFCDRYQCIKIGSVLFDTKRLLYSVPKGSLLGPILFSLYTLLPSAKLFKIILTYVSTFMWMTLSYMFILHILLPCQEYL